MLLFLRSHLHFQVLQLYLLQKVWQDNNAAWLKKGWPLLFYFLPDFVTEMLVFCMDADLLLLEMGLMPTFVRRFSIASISPANL